MPGDVFETEAWFANLRAHGFERAPHRHWTCSLPVSLGAGTAHLHLMQQAPGQPLAALGNYYSCLYGPVGSAQAVGELSAQQWQAFAKALRQLPGGAVLRLQPLDADSAWLAALQGGLQAAGYWTDRFFCFGNHYQIVPQGGFAAYWQQRPSALRHSVERGRRRLDRAGTWRIDIHTGASTDVDRALAAYQAVYAQSWKQPEPCPGFMPGLVRTAAHEGWLRLGVLWLGEQPLAAQVWLVHGGKANIYKLAYVKGQDRLSPGSVLTAALMAHAMDVDGVREVDYLSGDDAYKRDWMAQRRERVGLVAFDPRSLHGLWAGGRHSMGAWMGRMVQRLPVVVKQKKPWAPRET
ncbi:GNAT family N-acetyltransferase [Acidovorax sp.]|uniref:GNAT family N-acetyltransferase n=1 Tax=Acidovorax sp. TaxID=1872122 RepID=UPI002F9A3E27